MAWFDNMSNPALRWPLNETQKEMDELVRHLTAHKNGDKHKEIYIDASFYKVADRISLIPDEFIANIYKKRLQRHKDEYEEASKKE